MERLFLCRTMVCLLHKASENRKQCQGMPSANISKLGTDMMEQICSYLGLKDLQTCVVVLNKQFCSIANKWIWKNAIVQINSEIDFDVREDHEMAYFEKERRRIKVTTAEEDIRPDQVLNRNLRFLQRFMAVRRSILLEWCFRQRFFVAIH